MKATHQEITVLLEICRRLDDGFTLSEIVSWVLRERPSMITSFADAWDELQRSGLVRVKKCGRPSIYELVREGQGVAPALSS